MKKINFAFGIHCHQPVGNFDFVFDEAYHKAYQPFLDVAGWSGYGRIIPGTSGS